MKQDDPKALELRRLPLFAACTDAELAVVAQNVTACTFLAGERLMEVGRIGREFFVIVAGEVDVLLDGSEPSRVGPGGFVGEMALLDHGPRTATVVAVTQVDALVCSHQEFLACMEGAPDLARKLLAGVAGRLRVANDALATKG